jgi:hypothetical protein
MREFFCRSAGIPAGKRLKNAKNLSTFVRGKIEAGLRRFRVVAGEGTGAPGYSE